MKRLFLSFALLIVAATGFVAGCGGEPGTAVPATKEEIENDPAVKEPGV